MAFTYKNRQGTTYYLHIGSKGGGENQHFLSTDPSGELASAIPEGFELYESASGPVYLRKKRTVAARDPEMSALREFLTRNRGTTRF